MSYGNGIAVMFLLKEPLPFRGTYEMFTGEMINVRSATKCYRGVEVGEKRLALSS